MSPFLKFSKPYKSQNLFVVKKRGVKEATLFYSDVSFISFIKY